MWKTFKEEIPDFGKPIFVYRNTGGIFAFFTKEDDVRRCTLHKKEISNYGTYYYFKGYEYGTVGLTGFEQSELLKMKWMEIPKP